MKKPILILALVAVMLLLVSCAPGSNPAAGTGGDEAGFWQGWWNGFTILFTWVVSLFNDNVGIYEVNNNGGWYDFGYLLGVMMFWGGGSGGAAAGSKKRC